MEKQVSFTKAFIDQIPLPDKRIEYQDLRLPELRLRVTPTGVKSFSVFKRPAGKKPIRVTLGRFPGVSVDQARKLALKNLALLADGLNPNEAKRIESMQDVTLLEVYERYKASKKLKPTTLSGYESTYRCHLSVLGKKPLLSITRPVVSKLHSSISSPGQADLAMRLLRALFNFARLEFLRDDGTSIFVENPVDIISHRRQWNNLGRRHTHLRRAELPKFYEALKLVSDKGTATASSICDSMLFALFTGLRRNEILSLKWGDIDFENKIFLVTNTKNGQDLELPITDITAGILERASKRFQTDYVFGADNAYGRICEPKKVLNQIKLLSESECGYHDLRRTFATTAEELDVGTYKLKRLMNHCSGRDDVTAGYIILTAETLRPTLERIQNTLIGRLHEGSLRV